MRKNVFHRDLRKFDIEVGRKLMESEMHGMDFKHPIRSLFMHAWIDFENNQFSYDGPTFVRSRFKNRFELASFIHDWRNSNGYVGYAIDKEFLEIMIALNYPLKLIIQRWLFTRLTFANIIIHRLNYNLKNYLPPTLYKL